MMRKVLLITVVYKFINYCVLSVGGFADVEMAQMCGDYDARK